MSIQHVLIVDDEPDIRELLEITLGRMRLDTRAAADLAGAKRLLAEGSFDLCLTDMRLPDGSGIELVEYIQAHCPDLPVAVITAYGSMESAIQALKAGAFDFVSKPVDLSMLRDLVQAALRLGSEAPPAGQSEAPRILGHQRQRAGRARDSPPWPTSRRAVRAGELRRDPERAHGERVLRPPQGQLHRGRRR
jgi:two-component system response regulator PilR (NtrC family)